MAYTVKQVAEMSGVSVRTLHFYDETGLLKPARHGAHGYRLYEEPQLLTLQQILFYRELGIELKQIKRILSRADFEKVAALKSHREVLQDDLGRTRRLIETIERTLEHLKGTKKMKGEEMFAGFSVAAGKDRFDEQIKLGGEPNDCKVSSRDTGGAMCVFELTGTNGGPPHLHRDQDEWIYIIDGQFIFDVGAQRYCLGAGESVFIPRKVSHFWRSASGETGRVIDTYQPAGTMEEFFREVGKYANPPIHEALSPHEIWRLFQDHGMDLLVPGA
jgi:DNA-binding transcriptional MerR regulator